MWVSDYQLQKVQIGHLQLDTHVITRRLRDKYTCEEPITIEKSVIDTINTVTLSQMHPDPSFHMEVPSGLGTLCNFPELYQFNLLVQLHTTILTNLSTKEVTIIDPNPTNSYKTKITFTGFCTEVNSAKLDHFTLLFCRERH